MSKAESISAQGDDIGSRVISPNYTEIIGLSIFFIILFISSGAMVVNSIISFKFIAERPQNNQVDNGKEEEESKLPSEWYTSAIISAITFVIALVFAIVLKNNMIFDIMGCIYLILGFIYLLTFLYNLLIANGEIIPSLVLIVYLVISILIFMGSFTGAAIISIKNGESTPHVLSDSEGGGKSKRGKKSSIKKGKKKYGLIDFISTNTQAFFSIPAIF